MSVHVSVRWVVSVAVGVVDVAVAMREVRNMSVGGVAEAVVVVVGMMVGRGKGLPVVIVVVVVLMTWSTTL